MNLLAALSQDGRRVVLATFSDGASHLEEIRFVSAEKTICRQLLDSARWADSPYSLAISPDGKTLVTAHDFDIRYWDLATGKVRRTLKMEPMEIGYCLAFSPDSKMLAAGCGDRRIRLWNLDTGKLCSRVAGMDYWVTHLQCSPDGRMVAVGSNHGKGVVRLYDRHTGRELRCLSETLDNLRRMLWSNDSRTLYCGHDGGLICQRDTRNGHLLASLGDSSKSMGGFVQQGKRLAVALEEVELGVKNHLLLLDSFTLNELHSLPGDGGKTDGFILSPDRRLLASWITTSHHSEITLWNVAQRASRHRIPMRSDYHSDWHGVQAFSPDGLVLATGGPDSWVRLWDVFSGQEVLRLPTPCDVTSIEFAPDGRTLMTGQADCTVLVWDLREWVLSQRKKDNVPAQPLEQSWNDLANADGVRAFRAMWHLIDSPDSAVALLRRKQKPAASPDLRHVRQLLAQLDDDSFAAREAAQKKLQAFGENIEAELGAVQRQTASPEARRRTSVLLEALEREDSPQQWAARRALFVLEQMDTPEARRLMEEIATGWHEARQTRAAQEALGRLRRALLPPRTDTRGK